MSQAASAGAAGNTLKAKRLAARLSR